MSWHLTKIDDLNREINNLKDQLEQLQKANQGSELQRVKDVCSAHTYCSDCRFYKFDISEQTYCSLSSPMHWNIETILEKLDERI